MNILDFIRTEYISLIAGGFGGIMMAWLTQRILHKRGTFSYFVNHQRMGMSTEDEIFGNVEVTWNEKPILNLYLSTVILKNESLNDYSDVIITAYTDDTDLLTERTQLLDSPNILDHSEKYQKNLVIAEGEKPSEAQWRIYNGQREYVIPIFNRGDSVQLTYLNSAKTNETPHIYLSVVQKGVKLKYQHPQNQTFGENQPRAAFFGLIIGVVVLVGLVEFSNNEWVIALTAFIFGLVAQVPGAYAMKAIRYLRELVGG